jgi:3-hydroxymyristoyl/3-hydroxydecanoyl-(acyl carrier protein) dehydratase
MRFGYELTLLSADPMHAQAMFPPTFPGFDGHFPGAPILPGFMHVQLALDTLLSADLPGALVCVHNAKFVRGIPPGTLIDIRLLRNEDASWDVQIADALGEAYSRFTLETT